MNPAKDQSRQAKRILLLVTQADWGGVQSFLIRFAKDLIAEGREVLLAAGGDGELWQEASNNGIPSRRLKHVVRDINVVEDWKAIREIKCLIKEFKPDAIHLNSSKMGVLGSIAAAESKTRVVYRIGGWSFLEPLAPWKQWLYRVAEQQTARWKHVIITVHPGDESLAKNIHIRPKESIRTVPNGLDTLAFVSRLATRQQAREFLGIPPHAFVYGTVANAYATKGLLPYLDVVARVLREDQGAVAVIIGDGPEFTALVNARNRQRDVLDRIILTGHLENASTLYPAFDAFVLPSRKEGMPWTVLESMAAGIPVIATDVGACRWMLTDHETGDAGIIVPSNDPISLCDAMKRLRNDAEMREALARGARASVERRFTWNTTHRGNRDALDGA